MQINLTNPSFINTNLVATTQITPIKISSTNININIIIEIFFNKNVK